MSNNLRLTNNQDDWMSRALKLEAENERLRAAQVELLLMLKRVRRYLNQDFDLDLAVQAVIDKAEALERRKE